MSNSRRKHLNKAILEAMFYAENIAAFHMNSTAQAILDEVWNISDIKEAFRLLIANFWNKSIYKPFTYRLKNRLKLKIGKPISLNYKSLTKKWDAILWLNNDNASSPLYKMIMEKFGANKIMAIEFNGKQFVAEHVPEKRIFYDSPCYPHDGGGGCIVIIPPHILFKELCNIE